MVEINWPILLAQAGTFAVAVWVLWKFFWKRLVALMDQRAGDVRRNMDQAASGRADVERLKAEYEKSLARLDHKVQEALLKGQAEGQKLRDDILAEAKREAKAVLEKAQAQIAASQAQSLRDLRRDIAGLAVSAAEKAIRLRLDDKTHAALVEDTMKDIESEMAAHGR